jgi:hypothetical protein
MVGLRIWGRGSGCVQVIHCRASGHGAATSLPLWKSELDSKMAPLSKWQGSAEQGFAAGLGKPLRPL